MELMSRRWLQTAFGNLTGDSALRLERIQNQKGLDDD